MNVVVLSLSLLMQAPSGQSVVAVQTANPPASIVVVYVDAKGTKLERSATLIRSAPVAPACQQPPAERIEVRYIRPRPLWRGIRLPRLRLFSCL